MGIASDISVSFPPKKIHRNLRGPLQGSLHRGFLGRFFWKVGFLLGCQFLQEIYHIRWTYCWWFRNPDIQLIYVDMVNISDSLFTGFCFNYFRWLAWFLPSTGNEHRPVDLAYLRRTHLRKTGPTHFYCFLAITPWKFNIAPKNRQSQKETHLPTLIFQGLC